MDARMNAKMTFSRKSSKGSPCSSSALNTSLGFRVQGLEPCLELKLGNINLPRRREHALDESLKGIDVHEEALQPQDPQQPDKCETHETLLLHQKR